jgi:drug/metabolite transporter (DMT)-like permease
VTTALGVAAAALASCLYNAGLLLQADATRREPIGTAFSPGLLGRLISRRRWLAGLFTGIAGWPLQAFALSRSPLTVVQPMLGVGLVIPLLFGARVLGDQVRRRDVMNVAAVVAGVSMLVAVAPPKHIETSIDARLVVALGLVAALLVVALLLTIVWPDKRGSLLIAAAGLGFALSSMTTKLLADATTRHHWALATGWLLATIAASAAALVGEMNALQIRSAGAVASLVFAIETVVPVGLSPLLFGETGNASAGALALRACGIVVAIAASVALTRAPGVEHALAEG